MRLILFALVFATSCNTDSQIIINKDEIVPLSIANNFTMTYTDSTITRSYVSGKTHYDFSNTELNYSEFFEDVELIIYDDDKTSIIKSDYALSLIHI